MELKEQPFKCPFCQSEMEFESEMYQEDVGNTEAGEAMVYIYKCSNCGSHKEVYECPDIEKSDYEYWK